MKTETKQLFDGIELYIAEYTPEQSTEEQKRLLGDYMASVGELEKRFVKLYTPDQFLRLEHPHPALAEYRASDILLSYLCDNYISWEGGKIIQASVKDGREAARVIEHCLNTQGRWAGTPLQPHFAFEQVPFAANEARGERRVMNLIAGANHPQILWREMYNVYVVEK